MSSWGKHSQFLVRQHQPLCGGPPLPLLRRHPVTPTDLFFVRNHGPVPRTDAERWTLTVDGLVQRPQRLDLAELVAAFPVVSVTATLQCAGNRRDELTRVRPIPNEVAWGAEAVGTAVWRGVRLGDVLERARPGPEARHVALIGADETVKDDATTPFGGSIPIAKATRDEVLLAVDMNGAPLTPVHGAPLRAVVPGYIGARSVKWLTRVEVRAEPSDNPFQRRAYRLPRPGAGPADADWEAAEMLGEAPLNAVICHPADGARLAPGPVALEGYATAGDAAVAAVEVSGDGGETWTDAAMSRVGPWAWCQWSACLQLGTGRHELVVRARDSAGRTQPECLQQVWNPKGYVNAAWHRIAVELA